MLPETNSSWMRWIQFASRQWTEDIAQEAVFRSLRAGVDRCCPGYLNAIARNLWIDRAREIAKRKELRIVYEPEQAEQGDREPLTLKDLPTLTTAERRAIARKLNGEPSTNADYIVLHRLRKKVQKHLAEVDS